MRLFKVRKNKTISKFNPQGDFRAIKRTIILNSQNQNNFKFKSDYSSILRKCKQDLEILKDQVVDFTRDLEIL